MAVLLASKHRDLCLQVGLFKETGPIAVPWRVVETAIAPVGKLVLSPGTVDREGSLGEDPRAALTYVEKDYKYRLPLLGSMGGNQGTPLSA